MAVVSAVSGRVTDIGSSVASTSAPERTAGPGYLKPPVIVSTVSGIVARHQAEAEATVVQQPDFSSDAAAVAATPEPLGPTTFSYTIQDGDTIDSIAATFGLDPAYIIWNNPGVSADPDLLLVGETLVIPAVNGIVYNVTLGDTLSDIAAVYQVDIESIVAYAPNRIASADDVTEGMVLLLPGAVPPPAPEPVYVAVEEEEPSGGGGAAALAVAPEPVVETLPEAVAGFIWPFYGPISTYYGEYGHRGLDIDGFGNFGAPIYAAAEGLVVLASWSDYGYGYHVIIDHGDGTQTLYAHLSEIWVSQGQYVGQGEAVGALGSTGYSTGPHLHFEVHVGGVAVDPLAYLP
jgi:murein DD-endopeptidase MepM/ murein hydrolase activator NlpD